MLDVGSCAILLPPWVQFMFIPFGFRDIILLGIECRVGACPFICMPPIGVT